MSLADSKLGMIREYNCIEHFGILSFFFVFFLFFSHTRRARAFSGGGGPERLRPCARHLTLESERPLKLLREIARARVIV